MNHPRRRVFLAIAALAIASLVFAPVSAGAKSKKKKKKETPFTVLVAQATNSTQSNNSQLSATATCPPGMSAVGGGFYAPPGAGTNIFLLSESRRVGESTWSVSGGVSLAGAGSSQSLTAEAYCAKVSGTISEAAGTQQLAKDSLSSALPVATCPVGTQLLSGGFASAAGTVSAFSVVYESAPAGAGWRAGVLRATDATDPSDVSAFAYCFAPKKEKKSKKKGKKKASFAKKKKKSKKTIPNPKPAIISTATGALSQVTQGTNTVVVPRCAGTGQAILGGFTSPKPTADGFGLFYESRAAAAGWSVSALQASGTPSGTQAVTAYQGCV